jgi:hypothetical protein
MADAVAMSGIGLAVSERIIGGKPSRSTRYATAIPKRPSGERTP